MEKFCEMATVEVFKTNVKDPVTASKILRCLHGRFAGCSANFDLEDCDRILRIEAPCGAIDAPAVAALLTGMGFRAEVLPD
jgi:hypothetical protein